MEREIVEESLRAVIEQIWRMTLDLPLELRPALSEEENAVLDMRAHVEISGEWNGVVVVQMPSALTRVIALKIFRHSPHHTPSTSQMADCLKEIVNVAAGNLKTVLPEPCSLATPRFIEGATRNFVDGQPFLDLAFTSQGEPLLVSLYKRSEAPPHASPERRQIPGRANNAELEAQKEALQGVPRLAELLEAMPAPAVVLNEHHQIVLANSGAQAVDPVGQAFGIRIGELFGCIRSKLTLHGCGTSAYCAACNGRLAVFEARCTRRKVSYESSMLFEAGGKLHGREVKLTVSPLSMPDGQLFTIVAITDISGEKRRRALEVIFFHDVLNTVGGMQRYLEMMEEESAEELRQSLKHMKVAAADLVSEIASQRDLTLAERDDLSVHSSAADSGEMLTELLNELQYRVEAEGKKAVIAESSVSCQFRVAASVLRRILRNLVKNACEASKPGGVITIGARPTDDKLEFWVHNNGYIPDEVRLQLFKRSFSTKGAHRGFGLYSVKLLSERYLNGQVSFVSTSEQGTTFSVSVPLS